MTDENADQPTSPTSTQQSLGEYLAYIRVARKMTLREVDEATNHDVSNAYLSQLEKGKISKPSPNILYSLAEVYGIPYDKLMEKAGYISTNLKRDASEKHGRVATFATQHLTSDEEEQLLKYLAFLRSSQMGKNR